MGKVKCVEEVLVTYINAPGEPQKLLGKSETRKKILIQDICRLGFHEWGQKQFANRKTFGLHSATLQIVYMLLCDNR